MLGSFNRLNNSILVVSPLGYTGLAYYDYSLCQSLSEIGFNIQLCTSDKWLLGSYNNKFKIVKLYKKCSGNISKIRKGINYIISSINICKYIIKKNIQIVHYQILEFPIIDLMIMALLKMIGRTIIYTPHDLIPNKQYYFKQNITNWIYSISDEIIVHKKINKEYLLKQDRINQNKINVIPHGGYEYFVDNTITKEKARKILHLKSNLKIISYCGNITRIKGLHLLLEAMPIIYEKVSNIHLLIAGKPHMSFPKDTIIKQINMLSIKDLVTFNLEFIENNIFTQFYMASDLVILPYLRIYESGILKYAQTCKIPVLCSDLPEFKESMTEGETGYLFKTNDHYDLANSIIDIFNKDKLSRIKKTYNKSVDKLSWQPIACKTKIIYDRYMK